PVDRGEGSVNLCAQRRGASALFAEGIRLFELLHRAVEIPSHVVSVHRGLHQLFGRIVPRRAGGDRRLRREASCQTEKCADPENRLHRKKASVPTRCQPRIRAEATWPSQTTETISALES